MFGVADALLGIHFEKACGRVFVHTDTLFFILLFDVVIRVTARRLF